MTTIYSKRHALNTSRLGPMEFVVMTLGVLNRNGRLYEHAAVSKAVAIYTAKINGLDHNAKFGGFMGEVDKHSGMIDLARITHRVDGIRIQGDEVIVKIQVLNTRHGQILQGMLDQDDVEFRTSGHCVFEPDMMTVRNFVLLGIHALPKGTGA